VPRSNVGVKHAAGSGSEFSLLEQIAPLAAHMIRTQLVRGLGEVLCEPPHEAHIVVNRTRRMVATLELFEQLFAKMSHTRLAPVAHSLSRPQNSTANTRGDCGFVLTALQS
jgi:hypothetical protein